MSETPEDRLKRMRMRAWRRGTKEMDLVLGPYADAHLADMRPAELDLFDSVLAENDTDLLPWVLGQAAAPENLVDILHKIAVFARMRMTPHHQPG